MLSGARKRKLISFFVVCRAKVCLVATLRDSTSHSAFFYLSTPTTTASSFPHHLIPSHFSKRLRSRNQGAPSSRSRISTIPTTTTRNYLTFSRHLDVRGRQDSTMSNLYFKKDVHKSLEGLLYGLYVYQYLLDTSTFGLLLRCLVQEVSTYNH